MISPEDAATAVAQAGVPVVFIDTCSLLDLVRGRDDFSGDQARGAMEILALAEANRLSIVLPEQVINEVSAHEADIKADGIKLVDKLVDRTQQIVNAISHYSGQQLAYTPPSGQGYMAAAEPALARFLAVASVSTTSAAATSSAVARSLTGNAPAGPGKEAFKDCLVMESCYEVLSLARARGFTASAHFLSGNTREYAENKQLHSCLTADFAALGMDYSINFLELRYGAALKNLQP